MATNNIDAPAVEVPDPTGDNGDQPEEPAAMARRWMDKSRDLLAAIVESSEDAIISAALDGTIISWNAGASQLYGYEPKEILGRHVTVLAPTQRLGEAPGLLARLVTGEHIEHFESWRKRKDGSEFPVSLTVSPIRDASGRIIAAASITRDLTERRRAEEQALEITRRKLAEDVASEDRQRLVESQRLAHLGSWETDAATGRTTWSEELYRILGVEPGEEEPSADGFLARVHAGDREQLEHLITADHESAELVHRVVCPDGEVRWAHSRREVVRSADGAVVKVRGTSLDITELKRVEQNLWAAEAKFHSGFQTSTLGMALQAPDGRFLMVNPALCEMLDRTEDELMNITFPQLSYPEDVSTVYEQKERMLSGRGHTYQTEKRFLRGDGEEMWGLLNVSLVRDAEGAPDYFFTQIQDISDRKRAGREAQTRAVQQATVSSLGGRALAGTDPATLMKEAVDAVSDCLGNECAVIFEVRDSDVLALVAAACGHDRRGQPVEVLAGGESPARYTLAIDDAVVVADLGTDTRVAPSPLLIDHGLVSGLNVIISVVGRPYGVLAAYSATPSRFSDYDVNFVQAVANVVASAIERRHHEEAQQRAHQQERLAAVGQLAAGVAHDFNNILSAISLYAELIEGRQHLDDTGRSHMGAIREQVDRAVTLVWQVLDFAHRSPVRHADIDVAQFVAELLPVMRGMMPDRVRIDVRHDAQPYLVRADSTRLQQIFMNLVSNARDAMRHSGELTITLSRQARSAADPRGRPEPNGERSIRIDVADTGSGIPADVVARVFEPFFTTKPPGRGTGLGLAQVHGLVSQHDGHVEIDSSPGEGTTVSFWLPQVEATRGADRALRSGVAGGSGERLLVVDDDPAVRAALAPVLESCGYQVNVVADGEEALMALEIGASSFNAVVSDVMMPGMGGEGLARVVASRWPDIPVILMSGHPTPGSTRMGSPDASAGDVGAGNIVRLQKPFSSQQLVEVVSTALRRRP